MIAGMAGDAGRTGTSWSEIRQLHPISRASRVRFHSAYEIVKYHKSWSAFLRGWVEVRVTPRARMYPCHFLSCHWHVTHCTCGICAGLTCDYSLWGWGWGRGRDGTGRAMQPDCLSLGDLPSPESGHVIAVSGTGRLGQSLCLLSLYLVFFFPVWA